MRVLWVSLALLVVDQATKVLVVARMLPGQQIPLLGDWLKLTYTTNPGMAFGLTLGSKLFLTLFSVAATVLIVAYLWMVRTGPLGYRLALATIIGGASGNVIDRVFYGRIYDYAPLFYGEVVDFIHVDLWRGFLEVPLLGARYVTLFPIWNVADMAIVVGVASVILLQHRFHRQMEAERLAARTAAPPAPGTPLEEAEALSTDEAPVVSVAEPPPEAPEPPHA